MRSDGVFSAEMPDEPSQAIVPLDADTAERLLCARLDPDDAPPGYAEVARLLQAAAAPADPIELTGQAAAMDLFRTTHPRPAQLPTSPGGTRARPTGSTGRPGGSRDRGEASRGRPTPSRGRASGARARLVAVVLAGAVAATAVGVWTAGGAPFSGELGSPSGGPGSGTPGLGHAGAGGSGAGSGAGATGSLRPAWPGLGSAPSNTLLPDGRPAAAASAREPATARHPGGETSPGRSGHGSKHPTHPGKPPKAEPPRPEPLKPEPPKAEPPRPDPPKVKPLKAESSGPKTGND
jgi:hypothetical protein